VGDAPGLTVAAQESLVFYYFTTADFYTHGTVSVEDGRFVSHEQVVGNPEGITEVRSTTRLLPDGRLQSKAEYLKHGEWVPTQVPSRRYVIEMSCSWG
jgi:hypothetical protein